MTVDTAVQQVIAQQNAMTRDQAYAFLLATHRFLNQTYLLETQTFYVLLTAGVFIYTLDSAIKRVRTADYVNENGASSYLLPESTKDWDVSFPGWRLRQPTFPRAYSVEEGKITLYGTPNGTSSGIGVNATPRLQLTASVVPAFTSSSSLPPDVPEDVYIDGAQYRWAIKNRSKVPPGTVEDLFALWQMHIKHLDQILTKAAQNFRPQYTPEDYGVEAI